MSLANWRWAAYSEQRINQRGMMVEECGGTKMPF
jgi:hypothetical protein